MLALFAISMIAFGYIWADKLMRHPRVPSAAALASRPFARLRVANRVA